MNNDVSGVSYKRTNWREKFHTREIKCTSATLLPGTTYHLRGCSFVPNNLKESGINTMQSIICRYVIQLHHTLKSYVVIRTSKKRLVLHVPLIDSVSVILKEMQHTKPSTK